MGSLRELTDTSLVTVILPRSGVEELVNRALPNPVQQVLATDARSTLIRDQWYQFLLPVMSPEQRVIQILVENDQVDDVMRNFIFAGQLYRSGSGAIFSTPCVKAWLSESFEMGPIGDAEGMGTRFLPLRRNLTSILCIAQQSSANVIARAAVSAGAPGPTIRYCRGEGLRAKLGLLRIAISPDKELIQVMVDSVEADSIFESMIDAGDLDRPGGGFIYLIEVDKGLSNISGVYGGTRHSASIPQIIQAIDDLKESTDWRASAAYDREGRRGRGMKKRQFLTGSICLRCIADAGNATTFTQAAIAAGAPGVSITYAREIGSKGTETGKTGVELVRPKEIVESILSPRVFEDVLRAWKEEAEAMEEGEVGIYTQKVPKAFTYLG